MWACLNEMSSPHPALPLSSLVPLVLPLLFSDLTSRITPRYAVVSTCQETTSPFASLYTDSPSLDQQYLIDNGIPIVAGHCLVARFVPVLEPSQLQDFLESAKAFLRSYPCVDSEIPGL